MCNCGEVKEEEEEEEVRKEEILDVGKWLVFLCDHHCIFISRSL